MACGGWPRMTESASDVAGAHDTAPKMHREQDLAPCSVSERPEDGFQVLESLLRITQTGSWARDKGSSCASFIDSSSGPMVSQIAMTSGV